MRMYGFARSNGGLAPRHRLSIFALTSAILLAACGGGGGGGGLGGTDGGSGDGSDGGVSPGDGGGAGGDTFVTLRWESVGAGVNGYQVLSGPDAQSISNQVADITASEDNDNKPYAVLSAESDLGIRNPNGDRVCFAVQAYNDEGTSPMSDPECTTL